MINYQALHDKTQFYIFLTAYADGIKWYDIVMEWPNAFTWEDVRIAKQLQYIDEVNKLHLNKKAANY